MVVDASALVAIELDEPQAAELSGTLRGSTVNLIGSPTLLEAAIVLEMRLPGQAGSRIEDFLRRFDVDVVVFTPEHWEAAFQVYQRYGKGRHPAGLNYGDCMSYAVAKLARLPLLYVGQDFARTDIARA